MQGIAFESEFDAIGDGRVQLRGIDGATWRKELANAGCAERMTIIGVQRLMPIEKIHCTQFLAGVVERKLLRLRRASAVRKCRDVVVIVTGAIAATACQRDLVFDML